VKRDRHEILCMHTDYVSGAAGIASHVTTRVLRKGKNAFAPPTIPGTVMWCFSMNHDIRTVGLEHRTTLSASWRIGHRTRANHRTSRQHYRYCVGTNGDRWMSDPTQDICFRPKLSSWSRDGGNVHRSKRIRFSLSSPFP
jgi:hypothetical protein